MPQVRRFAFVTTLVGVLLLTGINSAAFAQAETAGCSSGGGHRRTPALHPHLLASTSLPSPTL